MDKPKILVRYTGGGGGSFLCIVMASMFRPVTVAQFFSGHDDVGQYSGRYHNFHEYLRRDNFMNKFNTFDSSDDELAALVRDQFEFRPTPVPAYFMHGHLIRTDAIVQAWPETRVIAIKFAEQDYDQMAYNWVRKFLMRFQHRDVMRSKIDTIQKEFGKLSGIDVDQFGNFDNEDDVRLLTWIVKYASITFYQSFNQYQSKSPEIEIDFRSLYNGSLADRVKDLAIDLEIPYNSERQLRTQQLIRQYAENQQSVPWKLNLKDYE